LSINLVNETKLEITFFTDSRCSEVLGSCFLLKGSESQPTNKLFLSEV